MLIEAIDHATGEVHEFGPRGLDLPGERTSVSLALPDSLPFGEWASIGETLAAVEHSIGWWLGDWWAYGEKAYEITGEQLVQRLRAESRSFPSYGTCRDSGWVSRRFPVSDRSDTVPWTVHRAIASVKDDDERRELLAAAEAGKWGVREAKTEVNRRKNARAIGAPDPGDLTCTVDDLGTLAARGARFGTIYADPPWNYDNQGTRAATGNHYGGMTVDELCALPVRELAEDDAHLHLWTTNAFLFDCPRIFDAWGFTFKSTFVWAKTQMGIGNYWRNSHELMLTAVRGDATRFADHSLKSWLECDRGKHSGKPEQVRSFIERASPGPYLELFGRRAAQGWAVFGDQVGRELLLPDVMVVKPLAMAAASP